MEKRGFTTQEAQAYLGVRRRFFDTNIAPLLAGKGTPAGPSTIYERADLDAAWDTYKEAVKLPAGKECPASNTEVKQWDVQKRTASTRPATVLSRSTPDTRSSAFASAALKAKQRQPTT